MSSSTRATLLHAQRGGRLVHDDQARPPTRGAAYGDRLALPAGEAPHARCTEGMFMSSRASISSDLLRHRPAVEQAVGPKPRFSSRLRSCSARWSARPRAPGSGKRSRSRARRASSGLEKRTALPSKSILPPSGPCTPETHFMRVDLPAPLSPTIAVISPSRRRATPPATPPRSRTSCSGSRPGGSPRRWFRTRPHLLNAGSGSGRRTGSRRCPRRWAASTPRPPARSGR